MSARKRRLRIAARQLHRIRLWAPKGDPWMAGRWPDDDEWDDEPECMHCHGDGRDPFTDYLMPCPECG